MKKIAISLPDAQADAVESIRRREGVPRSRVIQEAIALYLDARAQRPAISDYEEGYRRIPERGDAEAYAAAGAEALGSEDWG